jgi:murein DD-endopeptidase MepM/ murein hydrolase activator NlpD
VRLSADKSFAYRYPFTSGKSYKVTQGPNGTISHQDAFAFDFEMPVGTPVFAARSGIVAMVKADSHNGGPDRSYLEDANFISVYHSDETVANYFHLNTGGVIVKEGQYVEEGELIGYSGNTGFTTGPHLHFEVLQPSLKSGKNPFVAFSWANAVEHGHAIQISAR